ncbi:MAG: family 16 glycosylhydrolase [Cyclobacteriaceae bacterium]
MSRIYIQLITLSCLFVGTGCKQDDPLILEKIVMDSGPIIEERINQIVDINFSIEGSLMDFTAQYELIEFSAKDGDDFITERGDVIFAGGKASIQVEIVGDNYSEITERFELTITNEDETFTFFVTILDSDPLEDISVDNLGYFTEKDLPSMELVWSDEFEGSSLNGDYWTPDVGDGCDQGICGWGNDELQLYTSENLEISNGFLTITATEDEGKYYSARIISKSKVAHQFGRVDIRARMPQGQGIWPAIWMLGTNIDQVAWPMCGEIDIMEIVGHEPAKTHGTVHYDGGTGYKTSTGSRALNSGVFADQFHVFSIVWDRDKIIWYLDNQKFKTFSKSSSEQYPFNAPFYFIMNVAIGGRWPGNPDETTQFPQEMTVDYIRLYQ